VSTIDKFLENQTHQEQPDVALAIRKLATNKDIRVFLTALCKYSKGDWAAFMKTCQVVYGVMQSSMLIKHDSKLMDEILRAPHIAMFFRRLTEEDA
jgi:hypothetical protein